MKTIQIECDECHAVVTAEDPRYPEFICIGQELGYGAGVLDGSRLESDLCPKCLQKLLGKALRIYPPNWGYEPNVENRSFEASVQLNTDTSEWFIQMDSQFLTSQDWRSGDILEWKLLTEKSSAVVTNKSWLERQDASQG